MGKEVSHGINDTGREERRDGIDGSNRSNDRMYHGNGSGNTYGVCPVGLSGWWKAGCGGGRYGTYGQCRGLWNVHLHDESDSVRGDGSRAGGADPAALRSGSCGTLEAGRCGDHCRRAVFELRFGFKLCLWRGDLHHQPRTDTGNALTIREEITGNGRVFITGSLCGGV